MTLRLIRPQAIDLLVTVTPPKGEPERIVIEMKYLDVEERAEYLNSVVQRDLKDAQVLGELVVGWREVANADGQEIPFTKEALSDACKLDYFLLPARQRILDELRMEHFREKNS